ncbi:MAG: DUF4384 domain-containing protein, partial [Planctomycetes bacterium]|nr:DUF4384 domain-containing protein [Planctomycetota bacterium]
PVVLGPLGRGSRAGEEPPPDYHGRVEVLVNRNSRWVPVVHPDALPIKHGDHIKVPVQLDRPAYLYVFWVDPDGETFPIHPWRDGWGTRPNKEAPVSGLVLPEGRDYTIDPNKPTVGVTTMVAFASPEPLKLSDADFRAWFRDLPRVDRARGDDRPGVWFENFTLPRDPQLRGPVAVESTDPYQHWQNELKKRVRDPAPYQMSMSFPQADRK